MIINYKGNEKEVTNETLIALYKETEKLNNEILLNDVTAAIYNHDMFNFNLTMERLESAYRTAVYNGVYDAFELEMYCKDRT